MNAIAYNAMYGYLRQHPCPSRSNLGVIGYADIRDTALICEWMARKTDWEFYFDVLKMLEENDRCLQEKKRNAIQTISISVQPATSNDHLMTCEQIFSPGMPSGSMSLPTSWNAFLTLEESLLLTAPLKK